MSVAETVLVVAGFLMLGVVLDAMFRKVPVPYTVMLVVVGAILQWPRDHAAAFVELRHFTLTTDIILFVFLPALVFEAGLKIQARQLRKDIAPILMLAVPALFISSFLVGGGVSLASGMPFLVALIFGALISATDPVAVIALFNQLGAPRRLTLLVEGESLFNDATAIVLFNLVVAIALTGSFSLAAGAFAVWQFVLVFVGGALAGLLLGTVASLAANSLRVGGTGYLVLTLALAYLSFVIAEHGLHVSGVMAVCFAAIASSMLVLPRLPASQMASLHSAWELVSSICNTLLFILIGLSINLSHMAEVAVLLAATIILVNLARASVIYSLVPLTVKWFKLPSIKREEQHIMWWGGLKGGLAIAMVLSIPESVVQRQLLIDLTAGVVVFTLLVNAPSIRLLIRRFGIDRLSELQMAEMDLGVKRATSTISDTIHNLISAGMVETGHGQQLLDGLHGRIRTLAASPMAVPESHSWLIRAAGWELAELEELLRDNVISQPVYLELHPEKINRLDLLMRAESESGQGGAEPRTGKLRRLDRLVVTTLREQDWATRLLSRYLNFRLHAYLNHTVVNLHIFRVVLQRVSEAAEMPYAIKGHLQEIYQERIAVNQRRVDEVRAEFPEIFTDFEFDFARRASLAAALKALDAAGQEGELSSKTLNLLDTELRSLMEENTNTRRRPSGVLEQLRNVPLFKGLPAEALRQLAAKVTKVTYLAGDVIIGEGDHGNALYILLEGEAIAREIEGDNPRILGTLHPGDFFGEVALLEKNIRSANVEARRSCVLLRINHRNILDAAEAYPELRLALDMARMERRRRNADNG
ncbi:MAG: hypothetical protein RLZZ385_2734 [Pseudomonadota bacterium]|jgi:CPA1 family monovalent cation:H+ antiporter